MSRFLFAIETQELLENDQSDKALSISRVGIDEYPDYPAGIVMLCEALFDEEKFDEAFELSKSALHRFPKYQPLLNFTEKLGVTLSLLSVGAEIFEEENISDEIVSDKSITNEILEGTEADKSDVNNSRQTDSRNFLKLVSQIDADAPASNTLRADNPALIPGLNFTPLRATRKISGEEFVRQGAVFPEFYSPYDYDSEDNLSVPVDIPTAMNSYASDTLAEILTSQGAFNQAIEVYNQLSQLNPDKKPSYDAKIKEILTKIRD